jgi:hypothetical protein
MKNIIVTFGEKMILIYGVTFKLKILFMKTYSDSIFPILGSKSKIAPNLPFKILESKCI